MKTCTCPTPIVIDPTTEPTAAGRELAVHHLRGEDASYLDFWAWSARAGSSANPEDYYTALAIADRAYATARAEGCAHARHRVASHLAGAQLEPGRENYHEYARLAAEAKALEPAGLACCCAACHLDRERWEFAHTYDAACHAGRGALFTIRRALARHRTQATA